MARRCLKPPWVTPSDALVARRGAPVLAPAQLTRAQKLCRCPLSRRDAAIAVVAFGTLQLGNIGMNPRAPHQSEQAAKNERLNTSPQSSLWHRVPTPRPCRRGSPGARGSVGVHVMSGQNGREYGGECGDVRAPGYRGIEDWERVTGFFFPVFLDEIIPGAKYI